MTYTQIFTRTAAALASGVALFFGAAWMLSTETREIPKTQVGFATMPLTVAHRDKTLDMHIWYPTETTGEADLIARNALMYRFHAHEDATTRDGAFPLIVLSHGSGGRMTQMAWSPLNWPSKATSLQA